MGRHEHRYFNGQRWTGDVADQGRRGIDVLASYLPAAVAPSPTSVDSNRQATAALILGIIAVVAGVTVLLFFVAGLLGLLAVIFGLRSLRRSRALPGFAGRGAARGAIALGVIGLGLGVIGYVLITTVVPGWLDRLSPDRQPVDHTLNDTVCEITGRSARYRAVLSNDSDKIAGFELEVSFVDPADGRELAYRWNTADDVAPGATIALSVEAPIGDVEALRCDAAVSDH